MAVHEVAVDAQRGLAILAALDDLAQLVAQLDSEVEGRADSLRGQRQAVAGRVADEERTARWRKRDAKAARLATSDDLYPRTRRAVIAYFDEYGAITAAVAAIVVVAAGLVGLGFGTSWYIPFLVLLGVAAGIGILVLLGYIGSLINDRNDRLKEERRRAQEAAFEARMAYFAEHGEFPPLPEDDSWNPPNWVLAILGAIEWVFVKIGSFFKALGQLFVLAGQAIRVNKWKICPLVKIPGAEEEAERDFGYLY